MTSTAAIVPTIKRIRIIYSVDSITLAYARMVGRGHRCVPGQRKRLPASAPTSLPGLQREARWRSTASLPTRNVQKGPYRRDGFACAEDSFELDCACSEDSIELGW